VKANDFSGKTVIPFCTSASSGVGSSASDLEKAAGTGTWKDGMRFSGGASEDEVKDWIDSMK
ncbi:MAG: flavodoxin, partial [Anaerovoracaceae bacterium]|nr:flavodoxin [Anaerovoracaceae bacterium]